MFEADPTKPTQDLLTDIKTAAVNSFNNKSTSFTIPPFAALLVRLSQEASATADKNLLIQKRMIVITFIVLLISIAQLALAFFQLQSSLHNEPQRNVATPQPIESKSDQKDVVTNKKPIEPAHAPMHVPATKK